MVSNPNMVTRMQKQAAREQILHRWDIKIPTHRLNKMSLAQLQGIIQIMSKGSTQ